MTIEFTRNDRQTIGVELELHLVDAETGDLVSASNEVLADMADGHPGGEHPKAKHELFQSTVEIITGVCETPAEARHDLQATLDELRRHTEARGLRLISSGTHPFGIARKQDVSPSPRYHELIEAMQWPARRLLICGMHVHVGVRDGERAITIINELKRTLPILLALSSSSPYFEGEDSGLASARSKVFESLPTAGLPPQLEDWVDFEAFMSTLLDSECITSIREVWWDIRPHPEFGTVELRMCDAPQTLGEVTALAALAQSLVAWCDERIDAGDLPDPPREWTVRENRWLAGRYGTEATLIVEDHGPVGKPVRRPVRTLVEELVENLTPIAKRLGCTSELQSVLDILDRGSGTMRQRRLVSGGGTLLDVVHQLADELADDRDVGMSVDDVGVKRPIDAWLDEHGEGLIAIRRQLHAHPELSGEEHATTELVGERLRLAGLDPRRLASGTGLVCDLATDGDRRPRLALRADLDALAMDDEKDVHYRSQVDGVAHACGHDVHTAIMLGTALYFAHHRDEVPGPLRFVFQPAEERVPGGAIDTIGDSALDGVGAIVGVHCDPKLDVGLVGLKAGPISSAADMARITLIGPGGHTARPEETVDMITVASHVVRKLPARVAAELGDPGAVKVVFGMIHSGEAANVIPSHSAIKASVRTPSDEVWQALPGIFERALPELLADTGADHELDYTHGVPPVVNHEGMTELVRAAAAAELGPAAATPAIQSWGGDDFAWYLREIPGTYVRVGTHDPATNGPRLDLHAGSFDVDETAIAVGVRLMVRTAVEFFGPAGPPSS